MKKKIEHIVKKELNVEKHENGKEQGEDYVKHVYFHHEEEVDSLSILEDYHKETLIDNNQQLFYLQVVLPKCLVTDLNDQKFLFLRDDIHEVLIVMHENSFLNIHVVHNVVAPIQYFHEQ